MTQVIDSVNIICGEKKNNHYLELFPLVCLFVSELKSAFYPKFLPKQKFFIAGLRGYLMPRLSLFLDNLPLFTSQFSMWTSFCFSPEKVLLLSFPPFDLTLGSSELDTNNVFFMCRNGAKLVFCSMD